MSTFRRFNFNFTAKFPYFLTFSFVTLFITLVLLFTKGLNYGVDFRGGAELQIKFGQAIDLSVLRSALAESFGGASVQSIGKEDDHEFLVKVLASDENLNQVTQTISTMLTSKFADQGVEMRRVEIVGPKAGKEIRNAGFQAMIWALLCILVYVGLRFDFKYGPGAVIATVHDVIMLILILILTQKEFTLQIVAALLTIIGYSVNDTVVVYDRVRENEKKDPTGKLTNHINNALNETLSRTILTGLTTLFVAATMYFFGGESIKDFFFVITLGVIIGTYSSVYVASPITLIFAKLKK
ncbi:MAG: protein translocase subunit SecF [Bacteriovoracaceae bacterium]|nr:protein translocase subunit SecF [Bacteriovoracaceae bacterium]